ncbi:MAG: hypothetical protein U0166_10580 [Acidobacteriota bacterium]
MIRSTARLMTVALLATPAFAFTEATYKSVAENSLRLAPPTLAHIADRQRDRLVAGALMPLATEGGAEHLAAPKGVLEQKVKDQTERVIQMIDAHASFEDIIFEVGVLSHYVADLDNPLNTGTGDPRYEKVRKDYESYIERSVPKFTLTFGGHTSQELRDRDVLGFARSVSSRSSSFAPQVTQSYYPEGAMVSSRTFDDRHTAFGIASLSYQNAIGDCARLYVYIWRAVNGDLRGTPFLETVPTTKKSGPSHKWAK